MEFEFIIPQKNSDLLESGTGNSFCVSKTLNERECVEKLRRKFELCLLFLKFVH
jgi:hypothetical protein